MLEFMRIQRFKSLHDTSFPLASLNLFSGLNGMGKSSLIQTLLLLRQSQEKNALTDKGLLLKGDYVSLGTGQDILSEHAEIETIDFTLKWTELVKPVNFIFSYASSSDLQPLKQSLESFEPEIYSLFNKSFQYLGADRISPKPAYEASEYYINNLNSIGNHGEYTAHYIAAYGLKPLPIIALKHPKAVSDDLLENINKWMSEISPGIRVHSQLQPATNSVTLSYAFEEGGDVTADFKPQNVGFGVTFVLPVLTAILKAGKNDLLIIENPEAHLHPGGQTVLGRLCSLAAANGVQLFIETHSDHFLNGIRIAVKENLISCDDVHLFYLERSSSAHEAMVIAPEVDSQGRIDVWPQGFFDEADRQLEKLL